MLRCGLMVFRIVVMLTECMEAADKARSRIDRKSLFLRHEHSPAGPGLKERFHGGNGS
jgi:hypothetical protein